MTHVTKEENDKEWGMVYGKAKCYDTAIVYKDSEDSSTYSPKEDVISEIEYRLHRIENEQRMAFLHRIFR